MNNQKRDGVYRTLQLLKSDLPLIQNLGRGRPEVADRYGALEILPEIIEGLDLPDARDKERHPIRIRIPDATNAALVKKQKETGQSLVTILLAAAREYRAKYPLIPEENPSDEPATDD